LITGMRPVSLLVLLASSTALAGPEPVPPSPAPAPADAPVAAPSPDPTQPPAAATPAAPPVAAAPTSLSTIVVEELPVACRDLGKLATSPRPAQALSARISLSSCLVEQKMKELVLCDCEQSVNELNAAAAPSLALLDEVFALGDPANKILARQAQGDLLGSFATRMLATVPAPIDSSQSAIALRETRLGLITPLVNPWFVRAQSAYAELDKIARANPQLAKNPAVLMAVRSSRAKLAQGTSGVAKR
jgi:hypothetical protein